MQQRLAGKRSHRAQVCIYNAGPGLHSTLHGQQAVESGHRSLVSEAIFHMESTKPAIHGCAKLRELLSSELSHAEATLEDNAFVHRNKDSSPLCSAAFQADADVMHIAVHSKHNSSSVL